MIGAIAGIATVAAMLAGCGGAHKTSGTTTRTVSTPAKSPVAHPLAEQVKVSASGAAPSGSAQAHAGQTVEFLTTPPGTSAGPPVKIDLSLSQRHGTMWTVTASANGHSSSATLSGAGGKRVPLVDFRYTCTLPPAPTFCPVRHLVLGRGRLRMQFASSPSAPIELVATVGPVAGLPTAAARGALVVPPFTPSEVVVVHSLTAASSGAKPIPAASAIAHGGEEAEFLTRLASRASGGANGAPQPVTVTIEQGPSSALHVTAQVAGGSASTATLTGAHGAQIELVEPRYNCSLPPMPTFCPATRIVTGSHRYALTFSVSPRNSVIELIAVVQAA